MSIIFIDMDGVFNRVDGVYLTLLHPEKPRLEVIETRTVEVFNCYLSKMPEDVKLVVSSSWKTAYKDAEDFAKVTGFPLERFHKKWRIWPAGGNNSNHRAVDIKEWWIKNVQETFEDHKTFVILDDNDYCYNEILGEGHFIQTNPVHGLTIYDLEDMMKMLGLSPLFINDKLII